MEGNCFECGTKFDLEKNDGHCPDCGFGPDRCNHPMEFREENRNGIYSVDEGQYVEDLYCGKCGASV